VGYSEDDAFAGAGIEVEFASGEGAEGRLLFVNF